MHIREEKVVGYSCMHAGSPSRKSILVVVPSTEQNRYQSILSIESAKELGH